MPFDLTPRRLVPALLGAVALTLAAAVPAARAETPPDTLVIADKIDDIVSLDPAESFEFSGNDLLNNTYDTLIALDPSNLGPLQPGLAESWEVSEDGLTFTFKMRPDVKFHSGNPVRAEDAAWSLQRAVKLNKTPAFILTQFGFTPENVDQMIKAEGDTVSITVNRPVAPSFFYNILTSVVTSVVDKEEALAHEQNGDFGYEWLKTNTAGSGAYKLRAYKPADSYILEANEDYWRATPAMKRVFVRHVAEPATQRLLLEKGDIDIARKLTPTDIEGISGNEDIKIEDTLRGRIFYLAANQKKEPLNNPKFVEAMKHLIDYEGMANSFLKGSYTVHQSFLPSGFLGALDDTPFTFDVEKAKALLEEAGVQPGTKLKLYVRNDQQRLEMAQRIQNAFSQAGIELELRVGTGAETLGEYRARNHELILEAWGPDYPDPNTNSSTFAENTNNADDAGLTGVLAWRNAWPADETTELSKAAVLEQDTEKRRQMYEEIQRLHQQHSPFAEMFQQIEQNAMQANVEGFEPGGAITSAYYWPVTKE